MGTLRYMNRYWNWIRTAQLWLMCLVLGLAYWGAIDAAVRHATPEAPITHRQVAQHSVAQKTDCRAVPCITLTFDDGPNAVTTPQVLDTLKKEKVHATFFVVGSHVPAQAQLVRRIHLEGHEIGNHSWSHPHMEKLNPRQVRQQILQTQWVIERAGAPAPTLFRPPYGEMSATVRKYVPLTFMLWNEDPRDWAATKPQQVVAAVVADARPGGIIDMHDVYHVTARALPQIIHDLKKKGYHFVTASQLMDLRPGQKGVYYGYK